MSALIDNAAEHRFEMDTAFLTYRRSPGQIQLIHTEVPVELRGSGLGSKLVAGVLEAARTEGLKVVPVCPFVTDYLQRHPDHGSSL